MDEVRKQLEAVFELALKNGVLINRIDFVSFDMSTFGDRSARNIIFKQVNMDCSLIEPDDQPV